MTTYRYKIDYLTRISDEHFLDIQRYLLDHWNCKVITDDEITLWVDSGDIVRAYKIRELLKEQNNG